MITTLFRLSIIGSLFLLIAAGCAESKHDNPVVTIQWEGKKATAFVIPQSLLSRFSKDSAGEWLQVRLTNTGTPMLGDFSVNDENVVFTPLIPLTRGLKYELSWRGKLITHIEIPQDETRQPPSVISIYPSRDTVPENLLKLYVLFSKPMQEGRALENIAVVKNGQDTISSVFLDLEPELWNSDRTMLTIWLDPGRIKRDLQPNEKMGPPLQEGNRYQVVINPGWMDAEGALLSTYYRKDFFVIPRDDVSPNPGAWTIHSPKAGTADPLVIELHEQMDQRVMINAVRVIDKNGKQLEGVLGSALGETVLRFQPAIDWVRGEYTIEVEPRLEDLAGNNIERLFDRDLLKDSADRAKGVYKRTFYIR
jgi:hypothetical protein